MAKAKRNIGEEILQGLREIKHGEHGRVTNIPEVTRIRDLRCAWRRRVLKPK